MLWLTIYLVSHVKSFEDSYPCNGLCVKLYYVMSSTLNVTSSFTLTRALKSAVGTETAITPVRGLQHGHGPSVMHDAGGQASEEVFE